MKGRYVKIGVWVKLADIHGHNIANDGNGKHLLVKRKGKPDIKYRGPLVDHVKTVLDREAVP